MTPSGSRTPLLVLCQFWARSEVQAPPEEPSEYSEYGTAVHSVAELLKLGKEPDMLELQTKHSLSDYDRDQALTDGMALFDWVQEHVKGSVFYTERAYAFDTETFTARVLESDGHRDYSDKRPTEYAGTMDLIAVDGELAVVVDYKTGRTPAESYQEQLEFGALCVSLTNAGVKRIRCVVLKVNDGEAYPLQWEVDASDLDDIGLRIQASFRQIPDSVPTPGAHCYEKFCKLAGTCPATTEKLVPLMKQAYPQPLEGLTLADITTDAAITSNEQALKLYRLVKLGKKMIDALETSLQRYADSIGGLPVSHDKVWAADDRSREYYRLTDKAAEYLRKELGNKFGAIEANISKGSLKKAAGARLEAVLDGLRRIGASKPSAYVTYVEKKAS